MESPGLVVLAILAIGALFVLLPVALAALSEHRVGRSVVCPETNRAASVDIDSGHAARGAIFGKQWLRARSCSLWPEKKGCAEACLRPPDALSAGPGD